MRPSAWIAVLCLLPGGVACRKPQDAGVAAAQEASAPVHVTTVPVVERPMPQLLTLTGNLRASADSDIAADVSGRVIATYVERGQPVKAGQTIAIVDSRIASLTATAAAAQAKVAQSQLEEARRDCERVEHLLDTGAISQAEFDRQNTQCTAQQFSAEAAEAQQRTALTLAGDSTIRAPFAGVIGERAVNVGQYVQPPTHVASIYVPDPLRLELTVPEANVAAIKVDMPVHFTVTAYGDKDFTGTVKFISPNVRETSRDLVVEAVVPNADLALKPGMFAVAKINLGDAPRPVVPRSAVSQDDTGARLFVVADSQIQERLVQLGQAVGDVVAVVQGVKAGEAVVVTPGPGVRDGARVD